MKNEEMEYLCVCLFVASMLGLSHWALTAVFNIVSVLRQIITLHGKGGMWCNTIDQITTSMLKLYYCDND